MAPDSPSDPYELVGQVLAGKYEVEQVFAEGGFSVVYRGRHRIWKKPIAIKVLKALSTVGREIGEALNEAFVREGALLAELSSRTTAIVQAWDVGVHAGVNGQMLPYLVLEWLDGEPLDRALLREEGSPWTLADAMALMGPVARALDLAHQRGIAHRDIKPENLILVGDLRSPDATLKILDFGVAKVMDNRAVRAALAKTGGGLRSFTPAYGTPEQFTTTHGATGPWTDVYALALIMVELLTGKRALDGEEVVELAHATTNSQRRPTPWGRGALVAERVERVFKKALEILPSERYATAGEFWDALERARSTSVTMTASEPVPIPIEMPATTLTNPNQTIDPTLDSARVDVVTRDVASQGGITSNTVDRSPARRRLITAITVLAALLGALVTAAVANHRTTVGKLRQVAAAPAAVALVQSTRFQCPTGMVKIPAGEFFMGSDAEDALATEKPAFSVKLDGFCLDVNEVTTDQYLACSNAGKCKRASNVVRWPKMTDTQRELYSPLCNVNDPARGNHPINCVEWSMAQRYCEIQGGRLPTEAEWEYATRGPDGRIYPWGDEDPTPEHLNACGAECLAWGRQNAEDLAPLYKGSDGYPTTAPVGRFPLGRSRFGPNDVVGNVWEWVADWTGPYTTEPKTNPRGAPSGDRRVIRGGAWNGSYKSWLRPSFRYAQDPTAFSHGIGFRCAVDVPRPTTLTLAANGADEP